MQLGLEGAPVSAPSYCEELSRVAAAADQQLADEVYYLPRVLSWDDDRALAALRRVGVPPSQHDFEMGLPPHVTPVLLTALYGVMKCPGDFRAALALVLRSGGEVDVAAGVAGAVLGASLGTEGIPVRLRKNVLYGDALAGAAERLFGFRAEQVPVVVVPRASSSRRA